MHSWQHSLFQKWKFYALSCSHTLKPEWRRGQATKPASRSRVMSPLASLLYLAHSFLPPWLPWACFLETLTMPAGEEQAANTKKQLRCKEVGVGLYVLWQLLTLDTVTKGWRKQKSSLDLKNKFFSLLLFPCIPGAGLRTRQGQEETNNWIFWRSTWASLTYGSPSQKGVNRWLPHSILCCTQGHGKKWKSRRDFFKLLWFLRVFQLFCKNLSPMLRISKWGQG